MPWTKVTGVGVLATAGALAARYAAQQRRIERSWPAQVAPRLAQIGEVDQVSILPLVERLVPDRPPGPGGRLHGEPGVAYLLQARTTTETTTVLFDVGFNPRGRTRSALAGNADTLGVKLGAVDAVVISHVHADHVGGLGNALPPPGRPAGAAATASTSPSPMRGQAVSLRVRPGVVRGMAPRRPMPLRARRGARRRRRADLHLRTAVGG